MLSLGERNRFSRLRALVLVLWNSSLGSIFLHLAVAKFSLLVNYSDFFSCKDSKTLGYFPAQGSLCRKHEYDMLSPWEVVALLPAVTKTNLLPGTFLTYSHSRKGSLLSR